MFSAHIETSPPQIHISLPILLKCATYFLPPRVHNLLQVFEFCFVWGHIQLPVSGLLLALHSGITSGSAEEAVLGSNWGRSM